MTDRENPSEFEGTPPNPNEVNQPQFEQRAIKAEKELAALIKSSRRARQRLDDIINYRTAFDILITTIYNKFIHYPPHEIDNGILTALGDIGKFAGVDRSYILLLADGALRNSHEWCAPGIEPQIEHLQAIPLETVPWWISRLEHFEPIYIPRVEDLPAEARQEKERLAAGGVQSTIIVPMNHRDRLIGLVGFDSIRNERNWVDEDIHLLNVIADIFANAVDRITVDAHEKKAYELGHQLTALMDVEALLAHTVEALSDTFNYYHTQIYLSDQFQWQTAVYTHSDVTLVVREASGSTGATLKARAHAIPLNAEKSLVARSARERATVVVNNVEAAADHLPNPLLPDTHSEAAIPLVAENRLIGVLDLQHAKTDHFTPAEIRILEIIARQLSVALAKARIFNENKRLLVEQTLLLAVASASSTSQTEAALFEEVTRVIGETLYPDNFGILLINHNDDTLSTHHSYHGTPATVRLEEGVSARAIKTGQPQRVQDVTKDPQYIQSEPGIQTELCVPLKIDDDVIGVINAESKTANAFSKGDEILLVTIARQLETGLKRIRLRDAERHRGGQQRHLAELVGDLLSAREAQELGPIITKAAEKILDADRFGLFMFNSLTRELSCPYSHNLSDKYISGIIEQFHLTPGAQGITRNEPIVINNIENDPATAALRPIMLEEGFKTYAAFTLFAPRTPIGSLVFYRDKLRPFSSDDLNTGQTLAHLIAVAVQNIQLLSETNFSLEREQQLNEITRAMSTTSDLPAILASVVRMAAELVNADAGVIGLVIDNQIMTYYPYNIPRTINLNPTPKRRGTGWHIVDSGKSYLLDEYSQHPKAHHSWRKAGFGSCIGVPLTAGDSNLGSLELLSLTPNKLFSQRDKALVESIGRQAGITIQNNRHYTEARQRVGTLAATLAKQEELDQLKNQFIQNVSHELRTPLGIIYGHSELLNMGRLGELSPDQKHSTQIISRRVRMLTRLVEDLTALLAAETQEFRRDDVDLSLLMKSMLADFEVKGGEAGVHLQAEIAENVPLVLGDATHLRRVFDNLMSNAFKFTPTGGTITLRMWGERSDVIMEVSDTGVGIPQEQLGRIFERFYQVDGSARRPYEGTGLGLALVKEIVEAHRGKLTVHSEVGIGTTFRIRLPGFSLRPE